MITSTMSFALNRMVAPNLPLGGFLALAKAVGADAIEIRNDLRGFEFADGTPARELAARVSDVGLKIASVNALQRFNDLTPERVPEAEELIAYAGALGAPGLVLCPVVDANHGWSASELERKLIQSLKELRPVLMDHGVVGYVEPLGMRASTLRHQTPAAQAISEIDGWDAFALCHDTFQFFRSGDPQLHPSRIRLIHVSGITRRDLPRDKLTEPDRGFVTTDDVSGNVNQLCQLWQAGFEGYVSVEPFDPAIHALKDARVPLQASLDHLRQAVLDG